MSVVEFETIYAYRDICICKEIIVGHTFKNVGERYGISKTQVMYVWSNTRRKMGLKRDEEPSSHKERIQYRKNIVLPKLLAYENTYQAVYKKFYPWQIRFLSQWANIIINARYVYV